MIIRLPERLQKMKQEELDKIDSLPLTDDERRIVYLLHKGISVQRVAYDMGISEKTLYRRISSVKNKMNLKGSNDYMANIDVEVKDKVLLTLQEASAISNIGLNKMDELTKKWDCRFVFRVGTKRLIKKKEFVDFISKTDEI